MKYLCFLAAMPVFSREEIIEIGIESISPTVIGSIHQNRLWAYFQTMTVVAAPRIVCQRWRAQASRKEVPVSSRFWVFQPASMPAKMSKYEFALEHHHDRCRQRAEDNFRQHALDRPEKPPISLNLFCCQIDD